VLRILTRNTTQVAAKKAAAAAQATERTGAKPYDTRIFNELMQWKAAPTLEPESEFMARIFREDVDPCR
jgi:hypothetical protein